MATNASNDLTIPFHKHCQQTVCSAYGWGGQGATWEIISNLQLGHLPEEWKDFFMENENNITQDLASILKLIDTIAGRIGETIDSIKFTISFKDTKGNLIGEAGTDNQEITIGRDIDLTIGGQTISFNTMTSQSTDKLSISLPTKNLQLKIGNSTIG